jgi:hypothetical protein
MSICDSLLVDRGLNPLRTVEITHPLSLGDMMDVVVVLRFEMEGLRGVRVLDEAAAPVWTLAGIMAADGLMRAGLPLDRLEALSPVWDGTAVLSVLQALAVLSAQLLPAARDAILLQRYPRARNAASRERMYQRDMVQGLSQRISVLSAEMAAGGRDGATGGR